MKLLTKTNLYTIFFSFCLFCLGGMLFYTTIPSVFRDELDEQLMGHRDRIIHDLQLHPPAGPFVSIGGDMELRVLSSAYTGKSSLKDTLLYDPVEKERVPFRQLTFQAVSGDKAYQVSTRKSSVETDDLMQSILLNMFFLFIALLAGLFVINFLLAKKVWQPFYVMLHRMKSFNLSGQQEIELPECNTHEFTELKAVLDNMASRIHNDYNNLKGFTENASHEMQTPLAIIKSRLELLVQDETLKESQLNIIRSVYEAANRLSRLNQTLILLSRIENRQFIEVMPIDMHRLLEEKISNYEELLAGKNLSLTKSLQPEVHVRINLTLADVLVSNLISNTIKHNRNNGSIEITLSSGFLRTSNTANPSKEKPESLFERFKKENPSSDSLGLGLSIVKQICDTYGFRVSYEVVQERHTVTVYFR